MAPEGPVGRPEVVIGRGGIRKNRAQDRAGAEPDEDREARGREGLPGGTARGGGPPPARGGHDEGDAAGGAVRVADDGAEAGVATRDPLLGDGAEARRGGKE